MPEAKYVDDRGFSWLMRVKEGTLPQNYKQGMLVGPPDLSELNLAVEDLKTLQKGLVDSGLVNAECIKGSGGKLFDVVRKSLPHIKDTHGVVRQVKAVYQQDFYKVEDF